MEGNDDGIPEEPCTLEEQFPVREFDGYIEFDDPSHTYFIDGDAYDTSTTGFVHSFFPHFDEDVVICKMLQSSRWQQKTYFTDTLPAVATAWENECTRLFGSADPQTRLMVADTQQDPTYVRAQQMIGQFWNNMVTLGGLEAHAKVLPLLDAFVPFYRKHVTAQIKAAWEKNRVEASGLGTKMHELIEHFFNGLITPVEMEQLAQEQPELAQFVAFYRQRVEGKLDARRTELRVFDRVHRLAGSIDMLFHKRGEPENEWVMFDWKRSKEIKRENRWENGFPPFENYPNCNYWHYALQLNTYKWVIERNTSIKITSMHLGVFHPNQSTFQVIDAPFMQDQVSQMMSIRLERLKRRAAAAAATVEAPARPNEDPMDVGDVIDTTIASLQQVVSCLQQLRNVVTAGETTTTATAMSE